MMRIHADRALFFLALLFCAIASAGCDGLADVGDDDGGVFDPPDLPDLPDLPDAGNISDIDIPAPPAIDLSALPFPTAADGNAVLIELNDGRIELDPTANDAITAVGACTDLVTYCFSPPALTLSACVDAAPTCFTDEPWTEPLACCPAACKADFQAAVDVGAGELDAFQDVFFRAPACFPGVNAALGAP